MKKQRETAKKFLESKSSYNTSTLLALVQNTFMHEEEIILLMKDGKEDKALEKYIDLGHFDEAEEFCEENNTNTGLLTKLLEIYFEKYKEYSAKKNE